MQCLQFHILDGDAALPHDDSEWEKLAQACSGPRVDVLTPVGVPFPDGAADLQIVCCYPQLHSTHITQSADPKLVTESHSPGQTGLEEVLPIGVIDEAVH